MEESLRLGLEELERALKRHEEHCRTHGRRLPRSLVCFKMYPRMYARIYLHASIAPSIRSNLVEQIASIRIEWQMALEMHKFYLESLFLIKFSLNDAQKAFGGAH